MVIDPSVGVSVVGSDFTVGSIIVVFQMFALQRWLDGAQHLSDEASRLSLTTGSDSVERLDARRRCTEHLKRFPWIQVFMAGGALVVVASLAAIVGWSIHQALPFYHVAGPVFALLLVLFGGTTAVHHSGKHAVKEGLLYLGE